MPIKFKSNLECPDLEPYFPHLKPMRDHHPFDHIVLCDEEINPECGCITHDEAAILYTLATRRGPLWLEIGSNVGWSGAHLIKAGCSVTMVDPEYVKGSKIYERALESIEALVTPNMYSPITCGMTSYTFFRRYPFKRYNGAFIDGNHSSPHPFNDAVNAATRTNLIVFHDYVGKPIQDGYDYLVKQGWSSIIYHTPHGMACCWKGDFLPPFHEPDPACVRSYR